MKILGLMIVTLICAAIMDFIGASSTGTSVGLVVGGCSYILGVLGKGD